MSRRESVGRLTARTQSASGPPTQHMVSVAVLPPRLLPGMAPPTGLGPAEAFNWDESLSWQHNEPIKAEEETSRRKSFFRKAGITTQRKKANPDLPQFVLRQVPYDIWRKHYAKDKDGRYRGTHAPAEDCLLKPEDVQKWRLGDPVTKGDLWTRGKEALPVYAEVHETAAVPEYVHAYDGPLRTEPALESPTQPYRDVTEDVPNNLALDDDDDNLASHMERAVSRTSKQSSQGLDRFLSVVETSNTKISTGSGQIIADGKTAKQIIDEAKQKQKAKGKQSWKEGLKRGAEHAMMSNSG